jgi:hypothetical protein
MENTTSFRKPITIQDVADMVERIDSRLLEMGRTHLHARRQPMR